jgi:hypothetical protein
LVCATKHVYLENVASPVKQTCVQGERINVTIRANVVVEGSRHDVGWYVARDGGDALNGTCHINGLIFNNDKPYQVVSHDKKAKTAVAASVEWKKTLGGDNDECGDVIVKDESTVVIAATTILHEAEVVCQDGADVDASNLDVAICFTWKGLATSSSNKGICHVETNTPGSDCSCYCTSYSIANITVDKPVDEC